MKIGVVGNRNGWELRDITKQLKRLDIKETDTIVTGGAVGVDSFAIWFAKSIGADVIIFHPRMSLPIPERYFERNRRIVDNVEKIIAFDLEYKKHSGTRYTINHVLEKKLPIILFNK